MQVKEYLLYYKMNVSQFAEFVGVHPNTVRGIIHAKHKGIRYEV